MSQSDVLLESGTNELEIIEFYIDELQPGAPNPQREYFGVNVAKVLEVIESPGLVPLPSAPHPCFMGTIPLRDLVLPVLDLSVWLKMDKAPNDLEVILVTEFNKTVTGFLVSGVTQIHRFSWSSIQPPSHVLSRLDTNCITGMVDIEGHFVLMLDLEKVLSDLNPEIYESEGVSQTAMGEGFRALIADDSTALRMMIHRNLTEANYQVDTANDGEEAWMRLLSLKDQAARDNKRVVDLVDILISDIEMPKMDGYTLTRRVKEDPDLKDLPVVLFSSLITDDQRHKGESVGADDQITKPEFMTLAERAANLIRKNHPA
ncbi:MAG: chemotaxis signal transduction protein CheV [Desulfovibrio sp.]|nr:MAG: chemotaxis signal transduction protein CheV [Desulfovibrio sp.]